MSKWIRALVLGSVAAGAASCSFLIDVEIDSPALGAFVDADSVQLTGHMSVPGFPGVTVAVNGADVPVAADGSFSVNVPFDPNQIFQTLTAEMRFNGTALLDRDVVTVVRGVGIGEDELAPDSLGVRLTEDGFAAAAPGLAAALPVNLADLVPPGTVMFDDLCVVNGVLVCLVKADIVISGTPPPSFASLQVALDPHQDYATIDTTVRNLFVRADVLDSVTHLKLCSVNFRAGSAPIVADIALQPDPADAGRIDANLAGVQVGFMNFATQSDCLLGPVFDLLLPILIGDVEELAVQGFEDFLVDPDGAGPQDSVMADLVEEAFAGLDLAGAFSDALAAEVAVAFQAVDEDEQGLTLGLDTQLTPLSHAPNAPDLAKSLLVPGEIPPFPPLTPSGQPYDLGLCLSATLLNQILKAQIEGGLLVQNLQQVQIFGGTANLTTGLLGIFYPSFKVFPPPTPVTIQVRPDLAPVLDGTPGPDGKLANVQLSHLRVDYVFNDAVQLSLAVSARIGIDLVEVDGALETRVSAPKPEDVKLAVLSNRVGENEQLLHDTIGGIVAFFFPTLAGSATTRVELPQLLGLTIDPKEVALVGQCIGVFGDFAAAPAP
jgi:hypothetical protein